MNWSRLAKNASTSSIVMQEIKKNDSCENGLKTLSLSSKNHEQRHVVNSIVVRSKPTVFKVFFYRFNSSNLAFICKKIKIARMTATWDDR